MKTISPPMVQVIGAIIVLLGCETMPLPPAESPGRVELFFTWLMQHLGINASADTTNNTVEAGLMDLPIFVREQTDDWSCHASRFCTFTGVDPHLES